MKEISKYSKDNVEVFFIHGDKEQLADSDIFVKELTLSCIKENLHKVLGFDKEAEFRRFLEFASFCGGYENKQIYEPVKTEIAFEIIASTIERCNKLTANKDKIKVFVFPTFNKFVIKEMDGSSGFCTNRNTIMVFLSNTDRWGDALKKTISHEFAHTISPYYDMANMSIGEGIIFDGLAEHFMEEITGFKSRFGTCMSKSKANEILSEIKDKLDVKDINFYSEVFFGSGKYPMWSGYAIGYYLVEEYLRNKNDASLVSLLKCNPKKMLSSFIDLPR